MSTDSDKLSLTQVLTRQIQLVRSVLLKENVKITNTHVIGDIPTLPPAVTSLLSKGLACAIPSTHVSKQLDTSVQQFFHRIKVNYKYGSTTDTPLVTPRKFYVKSGRTVQTGSSHLDEQLAQKEKSLGNTLQHIFHEEKNSQPYKSPVTGAEKKALAWLKQKTLETREIVVKNTDKNLGCAVISKDWYLTECYRQLLSLIQSPSPRDRG